MSRSLLLQCLHCIVGFAMLRCTHSKRRSSTKTTLISTTPSESIPTMILTMTGTHQSLTMASPKVAFRSSEPVAAFGGSGSALAIDYPAGEDGTKGTGAQWQLDFDASYEEAYLRYRVKFREGFDFVRGGKLPGLAGGTSPTGNRQADGTNGFTGRLMWRTDFSGVSGVPQQTVSDGISYAKYTDSGFDGTGRDEDREYWLDADGARTMIQSGVWYEIIQRVKMNDPGVRNGVLQIWLDGNLVLDQQDVLWRTDDSFAIDQVYFSTFFGGNEDWRTSKDEVAYFDDFLISTAEIQSDVDNGGGPIDDGPDVDKEPAIINVPGDFDSIQVAIDAACPGDTVAVRGQWVTNVVVDKAILFRGFADTQITAANNNLPVVSVVADGVHVYRFELHHGVNGIRTDADLADIKIERVVSFDAATSGIRLRENCHGAYLKQNNVYYSGSHGVLVDRSDDVQVVQCKSFFAEGTGFVVNNGTRVLVDDCTVWGGARGYTISGDHHTLDDNFAFQNQFTAFGISGDHHTIHDNTSKLNGRGFSFTFSSNNRLTENVSSEDELNAYQFRLLSDDNVVIDNVSNLPGGLSLFMDQSTGNYFDDFRGLRGRGGVVMTSSTAENEVHNSLIQDNERFGVIDRGDANIFENVTERRNGQ